MAGIRRTVSAMVALLAVAGCAPAGEGGSVPVGRATVAEVACFDADYPNDPTFATPEEAFADALDTEAEQVGAPEEVGSYERTDRAEGWVEYEVRVDDDQHLVWGITRDGQGAWGMTSMGGCWPAAP